MLYLISIVMVVCSKIIGTTNITFKTVKGTDNKRIAQLIQLRLNLFVL